MKIAQISLVMAMPDLYQGHGVILLHLLQYELSGPNSILAQVRKWMLIMYAHLIIQI